MNHYDAVLIPGGGLDPNGGVPPWTRARLDRAAEEPGSPLVITLSAGTVHKPPPLDRQGFPVAESAAAARYLLDRGVNADRILTETCSFDTIGNAFFARLIHVEPLELTRLLVVTSDFHVERTEFIFRWVFQKIQPVIVDSLDFCAVASVGLSADQIAARREREQQSTDSLRETTTHIRSLARLHQWIYTEHAAYALDRRVAQEVDVDTLGTY